MSLVLTEAQRKTLDDYLCQRMKNRKSCIVALSLLDVMLLLLGRNSKSNALVQTRKFHESEVYPSTKKTAGKPILGPGSYEIRDFIELGRNKPCSAVGWSQEERFKDFVKLLTPGPGSHGKGGIPSCLLEEKQRRPIGTSAPMDIAGRIERFKDPITQCDLGPGAYNCMGFVEKILNRKVSKRGPYDLFTGQRDKPIRSGYFAAPKKANLSPGTFFRPTKGISEDLMLPEKRYHGEFHTASQYPFPPGERIYLGSLSQNPRPEGEPGPCSYLHRTWPKVENKKAPPFLSSTPRVTMGSLLQGNSPSLGPGRYNIVGQNKKKGVNAGHRYVFKSRIPRYLTNFNQDAFNQEKLRARNVPSDRIPFFRAPDEAIKNAV